jgi:hypothetical protein
MTSRGQSRSKGYSHRSGLCSNKSEMLGNDVDHMRVHQKHIEDTRGKDHGI